ncbi:MAG: DUF3592 domain-containing protein [Armatimonadetes bacterium]|nr:DUF3592 domain-containing protein [Armatimonadota bacterium]
MESHRITPGKSFVRYHFTDSVTLILAFFVAVSLVLFGIGLRHLMWQQNFAAIAIAATGTVTRIDTGENEGQTLYRPTVRFAPAPNAAPVTFRSRMSTAHPYRFGESVVVRYDPANPRKAELSDNVENPFFTWGLMVTGTVGAGAFGWLVRMFTRGMVVDDSITQAD